jgi:hypothetical protein
MPYEIVRRTKHLHDDNPVTGYSMDLRIHGRPDGGYVIKDLNSGEPRFRVDDFAAMVEALLPALVRNHIEYYASDGADAVAG